jgi:hypothetical protein
VFLPALLPTLAMLRALSRTNDGVSRSAKIIQKFNLSLIQVKMGRMGAGRITSEENYDHFITEK